MIEGLRDKAIGLGFAAVGVAPAIDEVTRVHGWTRSVVCAAISYLPPERPAAGEASRGLVARIARGADYHDVVREKLERLVEAVRAECPAARVEICVDTNPLPERRLAALAGLGWIGKNGCLFVEGCGSWAALGEIVTDAELESESRTIERQCGDCTRCMDACPTGAITSPGVIDRARCVAALTQQSEAVQMERRAAFGPRVYGCDLCQEVCPCNAAIEPVTPEFAQVVFPGADPELIPLINLTAAEFRTNVAHSSIGWIRRTRIRRNAAIAAGNLGCADAVPALKEMLADENPMLRETAEWAIKEIRGRLLNRR